MGKDGYFQLCVQKSVVYWTNWAEYLAVSSLMEIFLHPDIFLG
jgi:hypothetical protein